MDMSWIGLPSLRSAIIIICFKFRALQAEDIQCRVLPISIPYSNLICNRASNKCENSTSKFNFKFELHPPNCHLSHARLAMWTANGDFVNVSLTSGTANHHSNDVQLTTRTKLEIWNSRFAFKIQNCIRNSKFNLKLNLKIWN